MNALKIFVAICTLSSTLAFAQNGPNPNFVYFSEGQTPGNWGWVLGDPGNWWMPLGDEGGVSGKGFLTLAPANDKTFPGAMKLTWAKTDAWASATLSGGMLDLSALEHKAELTLALKVESSVPTTVNVKMACGEQCEAEVNIADNLKQAQAGQWFALPLALDCFTANGLDASKINWPFSIGSSGPLELVVAEISLAAMADGDQGCVPNP